MKILIGTDGSEHSKAAIEECCRMFSDPQKNIFKVIAVAEEVVPVAAEPFAISANYYQELVNAVNTNAETAVSKAARQIKAHLPDSEVSTEVIEGSPRQILVATAASWKADLIVLGSHGRGLWGRMTLGSVSDAVVHHAPCPVLVVRKFVD